MKEENISEGIKEYFNEIEKKLMDVYILAEKSKKKGYDPKDYVEIPFARNMAERVTGLISMVAQQLNKESMVERIFELEKKYGMLDWRVALSIALEVAKGNFCTFKDEKEAIEVGIRTGIAYITVGIVASPLEGFVELKLKKRRDGKNFFSLFFSGPIRSAGGTAAAVSVLIADYIRKQFGYDEYDPTELEIKRYITEVYDYHERVTNLQYLPSEDELAFLVSNLPVQIDGDPSENIEVSNYKDLERVETNRLRNGVCLVIAEGLAQKAPKLVKQLEIWGEDFGLEHWNFLSKFIKLQKKIRAKEDIKEEGKIVPDYNYITDIVAGRPVLTYPLRNGGFRLRYGRSRLSGLSSMSIHPATMIVLNSYIGIGTQLKYERPGKSSAMASCDSIDGPIVKVKNGDVIILDSVDKAKKYVNEVDEILYLGDILINYGEFYNRAHKLVPAGYCEEWYVQEIKKALEEGMKNENIEDKDMKEKILQLIKDVKNISVDDSLIISKILNVPLHPKYTYFWKSIKNKQLKVLYNWFLTGDVKEKKIVLPLLYNLDKDLEEEDAKRVLELLGVQHKVINKEFVVIDGDDFEIFNFIFKLGEGKNFVEFLDKSIEENKNVLWIINEISGIKIRDKCGTFIGARMGRPEKAKIRKMTGSPHVLFPVGSEGGRLRCFEDTIKEGKISADVVVYWCGKCGNETIFSVCEECGEKTNVIFFCNDCNRFYDNGKCRIHGSLLKYKKGYEIDICKYYSKIVENLDLGKLPILVKGVRGTSNKDHVIEYLGKGILRALHNLYVNKDGTVRYDMTEMAITHFRPKEINVSIEKLKELGYNFDINGKELINKDQLLEIKPQDVILPTCYEAIEKGADEILFNIANFVDDELEKIYKLERFYNLKSKKELIGHLIIGLAPHTSAGIVGRIIGFSKTQGCFAHPYWHAAMRRDCEGDECCVMLLMDTLLNFSKEYLPMHRGSTQDAPLVLTSILIPGEVDDMVFDMDVVNEYPLELYEMALEYKQPWDVKVERIKDRLHTDKQYSGFGFTHDTSDMNNGVLVSAYKLLPTMQEKVIGQMNIAEKIRAVDEDDVARLVIERHFIRDIRGNLRKFSMQQFRCVKCNEKYRRPPLKGVCLKCGNNIIFTISEGGIIKYLEPAMSLAEKYTLPSYLVQSLELTKSRIESVFGKEKQEGLGKWF